MKVCMNCGSSLEEIPFCCGNTVEIDVDPVRYCPQCGNGMGNECLHCFINRTDEGTDDNPELTLYVNYEGADYRIKSTSKVNVVLIERQNPHDMQLDVELKNPARRDRYWVYEHLSDYLFSYRLQTGIQPTLKGFSYED
jgi:hypothetical protein